MNRRFCMFACLATVSAATLFTNTKASAQFSFGRDRGTDISVFYEPLAGYGEWVLIAPHGWVWSPYGIDPEWRPYSVGYWLYTEYGWTWMSQEPFGWATYHYGRWTYNPYYGWVWIPGRQWGPAWVSWREGDGWIGWAALPPSRGQSFGLLGNLLRFANESTEIKRFAWNFIEVNRFCETNLRPYIARPARNVNIVNVTQNVTNYNITKNTVINNSVSIDAIQARLGRNIPKYRIKDVDGPTAPALGKRDTIQLYRPRVSDSAPTKTPDQLIKPGTRPAVPTTGGHPDFFQRQAEEKAAMDRRLAAEQAALRDRQAREQASAGKSGISPEELRRRQQREQEAFLEQIEREKKLIDRAADRDRKGEKGRTTSDGRKYQIK